MSCRNYLYAFEWQGWYMYLSPHLCINLKIMQTHWTSWCVWVLQEWEMHSLWLILLESLNSSIFHTVLLQWNLHVITPAGNWQLWQSSAPPPPKREIANCVRLFLINFDLRKGCWESNIGNQLTMYSGFFFSNTGMVSCSRKAMYPFYYIASVLSISVCLLVDYVKWEHWGNYELSSNWASWSEVWSRFPLLGPHALWRGFILEMLRPFLCGLLNTLNELSIYAIHSSLDSFGDIPWSLLMKMSSCLWDHF